MSHPYLHFNIISSSLIPNSGHTHWSLRKQQWAIISYSSNKLGFLKGLRDDSNGSDLDDSDNFNKDYFLEPYDLYNLDFNDDKHIWRHTLA